MALEFAHGAVQWLSADAATTVYTISGLSFQPKALRFYWVGIGSSTDVLTEITVHIRRGVGFATSTSDRRCVGVQDQDNVGTSVCTTGYRTDAVAMTLTSTPAADGLLDLNSITSDGFTLIVDDASPVNITVFWEAWGGSDITAAATGEIAEPAATGNVDYTVTGSFQPNVVMFAGVQATAAANTAARNDSGICVGFASSGNSADNVVLLGNCDDASNTTDSDGYCKTGECLAMIVVAGGNPNARAQMTQFNSDGFRLNWIARATTGRKNIYLAIKGGQWKAGSYTIDNQVVNNTATVSGLAFQPVGLCLIGRTTAESTAGTSTINDTACMGTGSSTSSRRTMYVSDVDSPTVMEVRMGIQYDQVLGGFGYTAASTTPGNSFYDISAINSDGFTIIVDTQQTVDPRNNEWQGYLTFGSEAAAAAGANLRMLMGNGT